MKFFAPFFITFILTSSLFAAPYNLIKKEKTELKTFIQNADEKSQILAFYVDKLDCKFSADLIENCLADFGEIINYKIATINHILLLELRANHRLYGIKKCLAEEGYKLKNISLHILKN